MNVSASQRVYRAAYVYFCQTPERSRVIRIGSTMRPVVELRRLQERYRYPIAWICNVRAYAVLAPILWARFAYCSVGSQWFAPDRHLVQLIDVLAMRDWERLLSPDELRAVFAAVFPDSPCVGIAQYRLSETYIKASRCKYSLAGHILGK